MDKMTNSPKNTDQIALSPVKKQKPYYYIVMISAFLGALLLWFYAIGYDSNIFDRKVSNIQVKITGTEKLRENKQFMVADELNILITATISGRRSVINNIDSEDLIATVDVSSVSTAGENKLPIVVAVPNGVSIKQLSVSSVSLYLDEFITKTVPVNIQYSSFVLPEGLNLVEAEINPVVVTVDGPKSELDKISSAYIDLTLGNVSGSISAYGPLFLKYDNGEVVNNKYVKMGSSEAHVFVNVNKEKTVPVAVALTGGVFTAESAVITLSQEYITISGGINMIDNISQITISINETEYDLRKPFTVTKYISSLLPQGVTIASGEVLVTADVKIPDITKKDLIITADKIKVNQVENGPQVSALSNLKITLIGSRDILKSMTSDDITAVVDAAGVFKDENGKDVVYADFEFSSEIYGVYVFGKYTVNVSVK